MKKYLIIFIIGIILFFLLIPLPNGLDDPDYSTVITDTDDKILRVFLNNNEQWCFPPVNNLNIPEKLKIAILHFEDKYFYYHPGVNLLSLMRAFYRNLQSGQIISGASTITMQITRILQPKERTYFNKLLEIYQSIKIELLYSKDEIFKIYLNHAPYGGNIIGYRAASLRYYRKYPDQLTWGEAATLAVLPNAPGLISPVNNPELLKSKRNRLLKNLFDHKIISKEIYQLALIEPIPDSSNSFSFTAPHLTQWIYSKNQEKRSQKKDKNIKTTIKKSIQENVQNIVKRNVIYLHQLGIKNGAALVAGTRSGKVRAYVGSQDFFDVKAQGQVNGVLAPRSSGSLLKPFLYALCIDEGIILPQTLIKDIPSFYGTFTPHNADEKFNGLITVQEALIRSLNVPAVRLLYTYDVYPFYHFLETAGMSTLFRIPKDYGLPLILGGAETTVWDMAKLFRGLANRGRFSPLQIIEKDRDSTSTGKQNNLISVGACYLTLEMLKELKRPGAEFYWNQYENQWPLAWKTGTSYGQRDAWAVGVSPEWTIAVWVGNFNGEGNANLSGARCAGPILFEIFNSLPRNPKNSWFDKPENGLDELKLCFETGYVAGDNCEKTRMVEIPVHMKPMKVCPYHKKIHTTSDENSSVCSLCWGKSKHKETCCLVYPSDVVQFMRERGQVITDIPSHKAECPAQTEETLPMEIIYPQKWSRLWLPRDFDGSLQRVTLRAAHREKDRKIFWYLDDQYLGKTKDKHTKSIQLAKGWHSLEVVDEIGNRDKRTFHVDIREVLN